MRTLSKNLLTVMLLAGFVALVGCAERQEPAETPDDAEATAEAPLQAVAALQPTQGNDTRGTVTFTQEDGGVRVVANITGLAPGEHGFHVHENGDCSAPDATSAGGHFAPQGSPHGAPDADAAQRHVGDLGNLDAGSDGTAQYDRVDNVISLSGPNSIVGKAVIVHADADDLQTQPTGNAGARLACGVIEMQGGAL